MQREYIFSAYEFYIAGKLAHNILLGRRRKTAKVYLGDKIIIPTRKKKDKTV